MAVRFDLPSSRDAAVLLVTLAGAALLYAGRRLHLDARTLRVLDALHQTPARPAPLSTRRT